MPQIDNKFTAIWYDTTTPPGTALTGLSATISIRRKDTNALVVTNAAMTEIGNGEYDYTYTGMQSGIAYSWVMNPNSALAFVETGVTDPRLDNLSRDLQDIGGGFAVIKGSGATIAGLSKKITEKSDEIKTMIQNLPAPLTEEQTRSIINELEMPEIEIPETDLSNIEEGISELKVSIGNVSQKQTKLGNYLRKEAEQEKKEIKMEYEEKLQEIKDEKDDMEKAYKEIEDAHQEELKNKDSEKEKLELEANDVIDLLEKEIGNVGAAKEQEIKDKLKTIL